MPKLTNTNFDFEAFNEDWIVDLIDLAGDEFDEERRILELEEMDDDEGGHFFF